MEDQQIIIFLTQKSKMMKTRILSSVGVLVALVTLFSLTGCMKNNVKNASLKMTASSIKTKGVLKSATVSGPLQLASGTLTVTEANVNIANLQIEENSGNDVQQQVGNQQQGGAEDIGGTEGKDNEKEKEGTETDKETGSEDILLAGPFSLNISSGNAIIDQVNVYPGTFKKVDFTFQLNPNAPFNGHSIAIAGNYTASDGTIIPVVLSSDFAKQVQLPLANGGVTVPSNASVAITIVFDLNKWFGNLDLTGATVTDGKIVIDSQNNPSLLAAFEANVASNIDVENE